MLAIILSISFYINRDIFISSLPIKVLIYTVNLAMLILFYIVSIELIVEFNSGTYVCLLVPHLITVNDFSL
jgi:hypothetical protein